MLEGMYSAAAGMAAQQHRLDALSNDIANVNTVGYKHLRVAFRDLVYSAAGPGGLPGNVEGAGAAATVIGRGGAGASYKTTDRPLDVAIEGTGWLQVRRADGSVALTRNGQLTVDGQGRLRADGLPLQPPVRIPEGVGEADVAISADGAVTGADGAVLGRIGLMTVAAPDRLQPAGGNLHLPTQASGNPVRAGADARLRQGLLETSDVDMGTAMTDMMLAQRSYTLASRAIDMQDQMAQIANQLKR
jgi:flagellar basal-body rod protein FlgG